MNRRSFVASVAALLPLGWFRGIKRDYVKGLDLGVGSDHFAARPRLTPEQREKVVRAIQRFWLGSAK